MLYGFGSVAYGVKDNGFAFFLLLYYDQVLGLPAQLASVAIFIALVVDAISDPIVGNLSDRLHSRWGRRHPFMYGAALPVGLVYYTLWNPPELGETGLFVYLTVVAILVRTLITFYEVPSSALAPELTDDYDERTLLMSLRYFFGWAGGITLSLFTYLVLFAPTDEYPIGQLNPAGYRSYGVIAGVMMFIAILASAAGTHRHIPTLQKPPPKQSFSASRSVRELRETLGNGSFIALFGFGFFAAIAGGIVASMSLYFNTYFWGLRADQIGLLTPVGFLAAAIALALTPMVAARIGKRPAAIGIALAAAVIAPLPMVLRLFEWMPENGTNALLAALLLYNLLEITGVIMASTLVGAMMADIVEQSELSTGRRSEGIFFAARSFIAKSMSGFGILLATVLLGAVGFPEDASQGVSDEVLRRLAIVYAPTVFGFYLAAILCLFGYRISRADHEANLEELRRRNEPAG